MSNVVGPNVPTKETITPNLRKKNLSLGPILSPIAKSANGCLSPSYLDLDFNVNPTNQFCLRGAIFWHIA